MSRTDHLQACLRQAVEVCQRLLEDPDLAATAERVATLITDAIRDGGKVLLCGNGGSAADAQHLAAELIGRFTRERPSYPAIALSDNVAAVTAAGNDYGYDEVFARPVRGLGRPGDVLLAFSTSGRSANVLRALAAARESGLVSVAFAGAPGAPIDAAADHVIHVAGPSTARIQEGHMVLGHAIFELVEHDLAGR